MLADASSTLLSGATTWNILVLSGVVTIGVVGTGVVNLCREDFLAFLHRYLHVFAGVVAVAPPLPVAEHRQISAEYDGGVAVNVQVPQGDGGSDCRVPWHLMPGR